MATGYEVEMYHNISRIANNLATIAQAMLTIASRVQSEDDKEFLDYIERTLLPDLREMGRHETADDMERLVSMARAQ